MQLHVAQLASKQLESMQTNRTCTTLTTTNTPVPQALHTLHAFQSYNNEAQPKQREPLSKGLGGILGPCSALHPSTD